MVLARIRHSLAFGPLVRNPSTMATKPRYVVNSLAESQVDMSSCVAQLPQMLQVMTQADEGHVSGGGVYVGRAGLALALRHVAQAVMAAGPTSQLAQAVGPPDQLVSAALGVCSPCVNGNLTPHRKRVTFLEGRAGPLAVQAVLLHQQQQAHGSAAGAWRAPLAGLLDLYQTSVARLAPAECEILYGRAGYLWALLYVQASLPPGSVPEPLIKELVHSVLKQGILEAQQKSWPGLMYQWHDSYYLGAAHGVAGILYVLLHVMRVVDELDAEQQLPGSYRQSICQAVQSLVDVRFPSGNLPSSLGSDQDRLVQWCHGAPGLLQLLQVALPEFPEHQQAWLNAVRQAADVVWQRGLLLKMCGLDQEASQQLHRAQAMAAFAAQNWRQLYLAPDRPASLFEGLGGLVCLLADLSRPDPLHSARFPGFEL